MKERFSSIRRKPVFYEILILAALTLALTVPFINEAFHWDDPDFVSAAEVSAKDPTQFHLENYGYRGVFRERYLIRHPPLLSTYLGLVVRLTGRVSEVLFHLAYLVFPLLAIISMYALARRFTGQPLLASLLLLFSSGFLVMSHTVMGNLPGLAFWLAATAMFVWGVDKGSWRLLLGSGVMTAAAIMTFAQGISVIPLLLFYALLNRKLFKLKTVVSLVLPVLVYLGWRYYIQGRYGRPPAISYQVDTKYDWQVQALLVYIGGTIIFPFSYYLLYLRKKIDLLVAFLFVPPLVTWAAFYYIGKGEMSLYEGVFVAIMATAGLLVLYRMLFGLITDVMSWFKRRRFKTDSVFLFAWFAGVLSVYFFTTLPFVSVRHILPLFPPVILMFVRDAEAFLPMQLRLRKLFVVTTLILTLVVGLSAATADYKLANSYRELAARMGNELADSKTKVWVLGEFGFRYYMEQQGFEYLGVNASANSGDIVISSYVSSTGVVAPLPEGFHRVLYTFDTESDFPVRTMNPWAGAGFYGNLAGPIPVVPSLAKLDEITVNELYWETE